MGQINITGKSIDYHTPTIRLFYDSKMSMDNNYICYLTYIFLPLKDFNNGGIIYMMNWLIYIKTKGASIVILHECEMFFFKGEIS